MWFAVSVYSPAQDYFVAVFDVITERKQAEDEIRTLNAELERRVVERTTQLEAANREMEAFAYSVSHDLRAPLRGIDGWSLALLEDYGSQLDATAHQYLDRVRSETQRMGQLIDDLLRLSRVSRIEMQPGPINLSALAQTIAGRLQEAQPERQFEFIVQPDLTVRGDSHLLEIALTNLLSNAVKFTTPRPLALIEFGQTQVDGRPVYFVRDNGVGFDLAYARNLFGAFQRMHRQSEFPGTGIGLATVQRIVYRHGGTIWADAQVDQGATFYFTLERLA
jgi:signal transduction histidine kinase